MRLRLERLAISRFGGSSICFGSLQSIRIVCQVVFTKAI